MDLPPGEVPDEPGVHSPSAQLAPLRPFPYAGDVVQKPAELRAGEIGVDQQAGLVRHRFAQAVGFQLVADGGGAAALPHDGVVHRLSGGPVPDNGGLPLVGDPQGGDLLGVDVGGVHRLRQGPLFRGPDLHGVMFHPARLGVDLAEGMLGAGHDLSRPVEQDARELVVPWSKATI